MIDSILIANRGEIAVRLIRAYRELGIRTVAVYSDADFEALHVRLADTARRVGPAAVGQSYLDVEAVVGAALDSGADAVDPGYGLLSENAAFAEAVTSAGLTFIGPSARVIARMGDKVAARNAARKSNVPTVPGSDGTVNSLEDAHDIAVRIGYPVIIKSSFGGGGRGMRIVSDAQELDAALQAASSESQASFGRPEVFIERHVRGARHVEVQVVGDNHGNIVHLGDRDCSVQRRHQKLIEEAPAPHLSDETRRALTDASVRLAREVGYVSTGTVEFLYEPATENIYFLEMNTRLQVEHGVTEMVTGIDLVATRLAIANGENLPFVQDDIVLSGHAIEVRLSAEDPWNHFVPTPGTAEVLRVPGGPWLRADLGIGQGDSVAREYDSMFGKLLAWGNDRNTARRRLIAALGELRIDGFTTTAPYCAGILSERSFVVAEHTTTSVDEQWQASENTRPAHTNTSISEGNPMSSSAATSRLVDIDAAGGTVRVTIFGVGKGKGADTARAAERSSSSRSNGNGNNAGDTGSAQPSSPMDGVVVAVNVESGAQVVKGQALAVVEAMKMQMPVVAPYGGTVHAVLVELGDSVIGRQQIITLEPVVDTASV
ncbi:biotin carboxylase N-terminal domain-containing protein [Rhodococcus sp. 14-2483-1-2]|uniref:ATP-binding protein n=1 Tax=Rhodococcus sp. 14-2483-1-2 TaxID=2023147 RepID=UPI000B9C4233|nr:biotin carboxylase N-terminal domain-containing protein [Rhodococcus sp. 14-2483-1-2]OZF39576.1 hypothetical protein CH295_02360 [Rhodococcus sp. 14-2483-1-2]